MGKILRLDETCVLYLYCKVFYVCVCEWSVVEGVEWRDGSRDLMDGWLDG